MIDAIQAQHLRKKQRLSQFSNILKSTAFKKIIKMLNKKVTIAATNNKKNIFVSMNEISDASELERPLNENGEKMWIDGLKIAVIEEYLEDNGYKIEHKFAEPNSIFGIIISW